jgi:hypothetical protein
MLIKDLKPILNQIGYKFYESEKIGGGSSLWFHGDLWNELVKTMTKMGFTYNKPTWKGATPSLTLDNVTIEPQYKSIYVRVDKTPASKQRTALGVDFDYPMEGRKIKKSELRQIIKEEIQKVLNEGFAANSALVNSIAFYKKQIGNIPDELKPSVQALIDEKIPSNIVFEFSSMFPRDSFKVEYIRDGKLENVIRRLYLSPSDEEMVQKAELVKAFLLAGDAYFQDKNWYKR